MNLFWETFLNSQGIYLGILIRFLWQNCWVCVFFIKVIQFFHNDADSQLVGYLCLPSGLVSSVLCRLPLPGSCHIRAIIKLFIREELPVIVINSKTQPFCRKSVNSLTFPDNNLMQQCHWWDLCSLFFLHEFRKPVQATPTAAHLQKTSLPVFYWVNK